MTGAVQLWNDISRGVPPDIAAAEPRACRRLSADRRFRNAGGVEPALPADRVRRAPCPPKREDDQPC